MISSGHIVASDYLDFHNFKQNQLKTIHLYWYINMCFMHCITQYLYLKLCYIYYEFMHIWSQLYVIKFIDRYFKILIILLKPFCFRKIKKNKSITFMRSLCTKYKPYNMSISIICGHFPNLFLYNPKSAIYLSTLFSSHTY